MGFLRVLVEKLCGARRGFQQEKATRTDLSYIRVKLKIKGILE